MLPIFMSVDLGKSKIYGQLSEIRGHRHIDETLNAAQHKPERLTAMETLANLESFVRSAETGGFSAAARRSATGGALPVTVSYIGLAPRLDWWGQDEDIDRSGSR